MIVGGINDQYKLDFRQKWRSILNPAVVFPRKFSRIVEQIFLTLGKKLNTLKMIPSEVVYGL